MGRDKLTTLSFQWAHCKAPSIACDCLTPNIWKDFKETITSCNLHATSWCLVSQICQCKLICVACSGQDCLSFWGLVEQPPVLWKFQDSWHWRKTSHYKLSNKPPLSLCMNNSWFAKWYLNVKSESVLRTYRSQDLRHWKMAMPSLPRQLFFSFENYVTNNLSLSLDLIL